MSDAQKLPADPPEYLGALVASLESGGVIDGDTAKFLCQQVGRDDIVRDLGDDRFELVTELLAAIEFPSPPVAPLTGPAHLSIWGDTYDEADVEPVLFSDDENALRFVNEYAGRIYFRSDMKTWFCWTGTVWRPFPEEALIRLARRIAQQIEVEGRDHPDPRIRTEARNTRNGPRLNAMVRVARSDSRTTTKDAEDWDLDPFLLATPNCTVDLRQGIGRPHDPADRITRMAPVEFRPAAECPRWIEFLDTIFQGDEELVGYMQRFCGYALTADLSDHGIWFAYGSGGNGKSVFTNLMMRVLGRDLSVQIPNDLLVTKRSKSEYSSAVLDGKRFAVASEAEQDERLAEALVKQLTGGDTVHARKIYGSPFEFKPVSKILFTTNHKPIIRGTDEGIWRRVHLIPFTADIAKKDRDLEKKLATELPGILAWAVRGCLAWQAEGLGSCAAIDAGSEEYREEMDEFAQFLAERCILDPTAETPVADIVAAYNVWAQSNGYPAMSGRAIGSKVTAHKQMDRRSAGKDRTRHYTGLRLRGQTPSFAPTDEPF